MSQINTHSKSFDELLQEANDAPNPVDYLKSILTKPFISKYLDWATNDVWTTLDVDTVVFKQYDYHQSMAGAILLNARTMSIFEQVLFATKVSAHTKAVQYKALSEMLSKGESAIVKGILKKDLVSIYPNLNHTVICEALNHE
jgi:hypothetical protein